MIKVENLGKKYTLSHLRGSQETSFREMMTDNFKKLANPKRLFQPRQKTEEFWALKDVNFEVKQGERVGIIGRNGAGKSTLLKILSRITEPTEGRITINGRVASLLEVGTGFHPELTGRENIYLNGAILGMSRREIKRKFHEIVEFAEVEKFLDTPVKRYSSGMYVRLAFAVAAHLDPEILIVDEVLAVGDAAFQKKCLGKMEEVSRGEGRTVLFVSHNMGMIKQLCSKAVLLDKGKIIYSGSQNAVIDYYIKEEIQKTGQISDLENQIKNLPTDEVISINSITFMQNSRLVNDKVNNGENLEISIKYNIKKETFGARIYFDLLDDQDNVLIRSFNDENEEELRPIGAGQYKSNVIIPANFLAQAQYIIKFYATIYNVRDIYPKPIVVKFDVERTGIVNRMYPMEPFRGKLAPILNWKTEKVS